MLYFHGDIHGNIIDNFSYRHNPEMRTLTENDYLIVLGDCGVPWNYATEKRDSYELRWLNERPYKTIFITGNHDNYDLIEQMPQIDFYNGVARQAVFKGETFENIVYIDKPTVLDIQEQHILVIPGADSHDIQDGIIDGTDPNWKKLFKTAWKNWKRVRVSHITWWPQEKLQIDEIEKILKTDNNFDFILSHECPSSQLIYFRRRFSPTDGEIYLEQVKEKVDYKIWLHGHMHQFANNYYDNIICLYNDLLSLAEIMQISKKNKQELETFEERMAAWQS